MEKRKALYATLTPFKKKKVIYLDTFFYQGGKWYPLIKGGQNVKRRKSA